MNSISVAKWQDRLGSDHTIIGTGRNRVEQSLIGEINDLRAQLENLSKFQIPNCLVQWHGAEKARLNAYEAYNAAVVAGKSEPWPGPDINTEYQVTVTTSNSAFKLQKAAFQELSELINKQKISVQTWQARVGSGYPLEAPAVNRFEQAMVDEVTELRQALVKSTAESIPDYILEWVNAENESKIKTKAYNEVAMIAAREWTPRSTLAEEKERDNAMNRARELLFKMWEKIEESIS